MMVWSMAIRTALVSSLRNTWCWGFLAWILQQWLAVDSVEHCCDLDDSGSDDGGDPGVMLAGR